jgi:molybdopterin converting factor subunit 1
MKVHVLLFAEAKSAAGDSAVSLKLPHGANVQQLREELRRRFPQLASLLQRSAIAVNQCIVDDQTVVHDLDEIAWVPPVSGG